MKKMMLILAAIMMMGSNAMAQNRNNDQNRAQQSAERMARQTERMSRELGLEGDAKTEFENVYKQYLRELYAVSDQNERARQEERRDDQMSNDECYQKVAENLARQEKQITESQKRLEITKKYMAELLPNLTAQQFYKVFGQRQGNWGGNQQQNNGQRNWNGGQRGQGGFGGQGGGQRGFGGGGF